MREEKKQTHVQTPLLIIGGKNLAIEIRETANQVYEGEVYNVVADSDTCQYSHMFDSQLEDFIRNHKQVSFILGFTIKRLREKYKRLFEPFSAIPYTIISDKAYISPTAIIGKGCFIGPNAVISSNVQIGDYSIINFLVGVGHDAILGKDSILNPGAKISGHCTIGDGCLIGANSFIHQGVEISSNSVIDAMTHIRKGLKGPVLYSDKNLKQIQVPNLLAE